MKRNLRGGFTLMEMLIVVAIIAILVSISIPTFAGVLERSREATDLANVRSAYAQVLTDSMFSDDPEEVESLVPLGQKQDGLQGIPNPNIGGITQDNAAQWIGTPQAGGACRVYYDCDKGVILNWNGGSYGRPLKLFRNETGASSSWEGSDRKKITGRNDRLRSKDTVKLPTNENYQITFTIPSHLTPEQEAVLGRYNLSFGTLVFPDKDGQRAPTHDSGWKDQPDKNRPLTIEITPKNGTTFAPNQDGYLAINFRAIDKKSSAEFNFNNTSGSAQKEQDAKALKSLFQTMLESAEIASILQKGK